jgi:ADP-ribose pyrophosphatase
MSIERPTPKQKRPADARRVFKGILFDAYQWPQEMLDGSTATFEVLKRPDTVEVIPVLDNGNILIVEEEQPGKAPFISFPGGRLDENETPQAAALRELSEETGYTASRVELWEATQPISKIDWAVYTFIARGCKREGEVHLDPGERITVREVTFDQMLELARQGKFWDHLAVLGYRAALDPAYLQELKEKFKPRQ